MEEWKKGKGNGEGEKEKESERKEKEREGTAATKRSMDLKEEKKEELLLWMH